MGRGVVAQRLSCVWSRTSAARASRLFIISLWGATAGGGNCMVQRGTKYLRASRYGKARRFAFLIPCCIFRWTGSSRPRQSWNKNVKQRITVLECKNRRFDTCPKKSMSLMWNRLAQKCGWSYCKFQKNAVVYCFPQLSDGNMADFDAGESNTLVLFRGAKRSGILLIFSYPALKMSPPCVRKSDLLMHWAMPCWKLAERPARSI